MSRSTTAVVLSALVLPGAGHLYLKQTGRGLALIAVSLTCLWIIVAQAIQQASAVLVQLETDGVVPDADQLAELVSRTSNHSASGSVMMATLALTACWLFGIIDTYRRGKQDKNKAIQTR